jgi:hypothetical protein
VTLGVDGRVPFVPGRVPFPHLKRHPINIRDQSHFESMKLRKTDQNIKAAMQTEGFSSEVTILEAPTLYNKTGVIVTTTVTKVTTNGKGGAAGLHTSVMLMVSITVITVVTSTIN